MELSSRKRKKVSGGNFSNLNNKTKKKKDTLKKFLIFQAMELPLIFLEGTCKAEKQKILIFL